VEVKMQWFGQSKLAAVEKCRYEICIAGSGVKKIRVHKMPKKAILDISQQNFSIPPQEIFSPNCPH